MWVWVCVHERWCLYICAYVYMFVLICVRMCVFLSYASENPCFLFSLCLLGYYIPNAGSAVYYVCSHATQPGAVSCNSDSVGCAAGQYYNGSACVGVPAGYHSAAAGSGVLYACAAGTFSLAGASSCSLCPVGTFSQQAATSCVRCGVGTFSSRTGSSVCAPCGTTNCAAGYVSSCDVTTGAPSCELCAAGTYSLGSGMACTGCATSLFPGAADCRPSTWIHQLQIFLSSFQCL